MTDHYDEDIRKAKAFHGHCCVGIIFGARLARAGLKYLGIEEPRKSKDFIVFVEVDRCLTDAVEAVTGCSLGKRSLKYVDYGRMAASFINVHTQQGVRIAVNCWLDTPEEADPVEFWRNFSDEELFTFEPVTVALRPEDLPGKSIRKTICEVCGEKVKDGRDVFKDGKVMCKACAGVAYYQKTK